MTNEPKVVVEDAMGVAYLDRHIENSRHGGRVDATCPVCISTVLNMTLVKVDERSLRSVREIKDRR